LYIPYKFSFTQEEIDAILGDDDTRECIYKSEKQDSWAHLKNEKGIAKLQNNSEWLFKPYHDKYGKDNVYLVKDYDLKFLKDKK
jgi:hypothetical protein